MPKIKDVRPAELVHAVRAIASGDTLLSPAITRRLLEEFVRRQYGDMPKIHYHALARDGTVSLIYLRPVGPRTGVAAFIHGQRVYVVETDLLPGVQMLAQGDERAQADYGEWLEGRAVELAQSIQVE